MAVRRFAAGYNLLMTASSYSYTTGLFSLDSFSPPAVVRVHYKGCFNLGVVISVAELEAIEL